MDLTVGPIAFFWDAARVRAFYAGLARAPVARGVIGEWVCSKRLPFWQGEIPGAVEALAQAGKEVALSTLTLITLRRERRQTEDLFGTGLPVEIADMGALKYLPEGAPFWVGPTVNVYNEGTLEWLARRGARRVCLPPELPMASVARLARAGQDAGVAVEVWGHGRAPLAISGRCYHARLHDRAKDSCQFVCGDDPDGRNVDTLDGQPFLTVNGVQTLGRAVTTALPHVAALRDAGVSALRLSPQVGDFGALAAVYARALAGAEPAPMDVLRGLMPEASFADGFLAGMAGAQLSPEAG
ncbi:collagenase-like PrtC family protease [Rhodobacter sp. 140A]|jgi:collagenase-like PrtC family protease|uniref:Ubiquinone biosynthesis protein UbiV n=1 Tax=Paenirhodobacter hankyongi TaxID=2294033 RepID=A0A421BJN2_9RHOB|nr:U32 family peptidase [Sinirhodobacter hankyongi]RBP83337.1 collagenase-like PrtC family protease [Rhodobacter sp. 140A]RLL61979.1 U32 family peptidase [Sinirhodobacter hankyongi]